MSLNKIRLDIDSLEMQRDRAEEHGNGELVWLCQERIDELAQQLEDIEDDERELQGVHGRTG